MEFCFHLENTNSCFFSEKTMDENIPSSTNDCNTIGLALPNEKKIKSHIITPTSTD